MRTAIDVIRVKPDTKERFMKVVGTDMTADNAINILLDQYVDLIDVEYIIPGWVMHRYERVANAINIDIDKLVNAALLMGVFREFDQMTDLELLDNGV